MNESITESIIQELTADIANGVLMPGTRLEEQALADRFGVSRTPVREALRELAAMGLIENRGRRGAFVIEVGLDELAEMFETMSEIEALCAKLAAHRMTPFERRQLEDAHNACLDAAEAGDPLAYIQANNAFHRVIYTGTHNRYIAELANNYRYRTAPFRNTRFRDGAQLMVSFASHQKIISAINSGQPEAAYTDMHEHATVTGMNALRLEMANRNGRR